MQKSHRRSTKVCTRCRKRKTKCDFKFPTCTSCKAANTTCLGYDPTTRQAVPRSLVRSLEEKVAELEMQMQTYKAYASNLPYLMASKVAQATISAAVPPPGLFLRSKVSPGLFFRPSCPPLAVVRGREYALSANDHSPLTDPPPSRQHARYRNGTLIDLHTVPMSAITRMIQNYVNIHLPQYPCITRSMLEEIVQHAYGDDLEKPDAPSTPRIQDNSNLGNFKYFVLFIVLALSSMTLTWRDDDQARAASESFYNSALKHLQGISGQSEIQALQISLLLAHYAHMCPERVDNWACISNAIRIVLNLGLHLECPVGLSEGQLAQRSSLFWVAYGMERSLCKNLKLPLSFSEDSITAKLDTASPGSITPQSAANHICYYRALETEVHRILHLEEDLHKFGHDSIESWTASITLRLGEWYERALLYTAYNMLEFKIVQFHHLIACIHRPTPRLRKRSPGDRQIVLDASLVLVEDYLGQEQRQRLFYPWHGVHMLFETAIIALEACWSSKEMVQADPKIMNMLSVIIPQCVQLLRRIGQRWNEASLCANCLEGLLQSILSAFANIDDQFQALTVTQEIEDLLFSDGPLTWNREPHESIPLVFADDSDLLSDWAAGESQFFEWDLQWDPLTSENLDIV